MRWKPVPPVPADLDALAALRAALPAEPDPQNDCCALVLDADAGVETDDRDTAGDWLVFLRALGLLREDGGTYARTADPLERDALAAAFVANVHGARELRDALGDADGPADADAVASRVGERVGGAARVRRLLGWAVLFGLAESDDEGNVRAGD